MALYALFNEEGGYIDCCPVYAEARDAHEECASKCRRYSVVEISQCPPCKPFRLSNKCLRCERCAASQDMVDEFINKSNL